MTATDASLLKGKFDDLMLAVEAFGEGAKQLSGAHNDLFALMERVQATNQRLAEAAECCQAYLDAADQLITEGFSQQIRRDMEEASGIIRQCREQSVSLTSQYREVLASFAEDADKQNERQAAVLRAIQEAAKDEGNRAFDLAKRMDRHAAELQSALTEKAARMESKQESASRTLLESAKTELRKHAENGQEALSAEAARLSGKLVAIGGSVERLDQDMARSFRERTEYLEGKQQEYTLELLEELQQLDKKVEQLSAGSARMEKLLAGQLADSKAQAAQLSEQLKKQQRLMLAGMGILAVLAVLGLFI